MRCTKCGKKLSGKGKICPECAAKVYDQVSDILREFSMENNPEQTDYSDVNNRHTNMELREEPGKALITESGTPQKTESEKIINQENGKQSNILAIIGLPLSSFMVLLGFAWLVSDIYRGDYYYSEIPEGFWYDSVLLAASSLLLVHCISCLRRKPLPEYIISIISFCAIESAVLMSNCIYYEDDGGMVFNLGMIAVIGIFVCILVLVFRKKAEYSEHMTREQHSKLARVCLLFFVICVVIAVILFGINGGWLIAFVILGIIFLVAASGVYGTECPNCKERNVAEYSKEYIGSEDTTVKKIVQDKVYQADRHGVGRSGPPTQFIEREVYVPALRKYYLVTYKCPDCGYSYKEKIYEVEEL